MVRISGDMLEGGGQIIRTSIALSALLGEEVEIINVRGKRSPPGLKAQHITGIKAVAAVSEAEVEGLELGSRRLRFKPRSRRGGVFTFNVGTAGSIPLVLQALMPAAAFASTPLEARITGGTDVKWSPTIDYMRMITLPILAKMGYRCELEVERRGHYPKGGGQVAFKAYPARRLNPIILEERGEMAMINGRSHCVKLPRHVAERQAEAASKLLRGAGFEEVQVELEWHPPESDPHWGPGSGITLYASTSTGSIIGADSIGERGKPAEKVGEEAASKLLWELKTGMALDRHMGDMIIPYMAVAEGRSRITVSQLTLHTMTNIKVAEAITGAQFKVQGELNKPGRIEVDGIGLTTA
ncbi:MAG: RNA 3'-terminal phosphate cyclase [Candidatus Bathyarchaeia archaeon]